MRVENFEKIAFAEKGLNAESRPSPEEAVVPEYVYVVGDDGFGFEVNVGDEIELIDIKSGEKVSGTVEEIGESGEVSLDGDYVDIGDYNLLIITENYY